LANQQIMLGGNDEYAKVKAGNAYRHPQSSGSSWTAEADSHHVQG